jgi:hypothetical protein
MGISNLRLQLPFCTFNLCFLRLPEWEAIVCRNIMLRSMCDCRRGLEWLLHLLTTYTRFICTSNYSAAINFYNSQTTTATAKSFPACCVFTSRFLVTASNNGNSTASALKSSLHSLPYWTDLVASVVFKATHRHGPRRDTPFPTIPLLLLVDSLLQERVYRAVA